MAFSNKPFGQTSNIVLTNITTRILLTHVEIKGGSSVILAHKAYHYILFYILFPFREAYIGIPFFTIGIMRLSNSSGDLSLRVGL
ncbi:MAG: hypothetical protein QXJ81_04555 [Metallosphaera sp.]